MNPPRGFIYWMNVFLKVGSLYGEDSFLTITFTMWVGSFPTF